MIWKYIISASFVALLAVPPTMAGDDIGVLCRLPGGASEPESWNQRWDTGPGVLRVGDDCEAQVVFDGVRNKPRWVGHRLPSGPAGLVAELEIGVEDDFNLPAGESITILEVPAGELSLPGGQTLALVTMRWSKPIGSDPNEYELEATWNSDDETGSMTLGPMALDPGERLKIQLTWRCSSSDGTNPFADGWIAVALDDGTPMVVEDLMIDEYLASEVRFGYLEETELGTTGGFIFRPEQVVVEMF